MAHMLEILNGVASLVTGKSLRRWHGLGQTHTDESFSLDDALMMVPSAGWNVGVENTFLADGRQCGQATIRADGTILAPVGPSFTPVQTREGIVAGITPMLPRGTELTLQSLGVLDGGRKVFAQTPPVRTLEFSNGKTWETRLSWVNAHDGSMGLTLAASTVDNVCWNTVRAAMREAKLEGLATSRRHTANVEANVQADARWMGLQLDKVDVLFKGAAQALETTLPKDTAREIVTELLGTVGAKGVLTPASARAVDRVMTLATGVDLVGAEQHNVGSAYGLYAALTQYASQELTRRLSDAEKASPILARVNTHISSVLGTEDRAQALVSRAAHVLLGVS